MVMAFYLTKAQNITVTGRILSAEDHQPMISAIVALVGTSQGTTTDYDGVYAIEAPADGRLLFSFIGYHSVEVPINGQTEISVTLKIDEQLLEDVVVVGYKKEIKSNVSSAISTVKADRKSVV